MNRLARHWSVFRKQQLRLAQSRSYQSIRKLNLNVKEPEGYNVILPPEPFVFGVSHIQPRSVPDHIVKPPYARGGNQNTTVVEEIPIQDGGKIELGGEAELRIREAALLAKKVREFAATQVKV